MSLSQRDTDLIFRKRKITGQNAITSLKRNTQLRRKSEECTGRRAQGTKATDNNTNEGKGIARFAVEMSTGLLRSGNADNQVSLTE